MYTYFFKFQSFIDLKFKNNRTIIIEHSERALFSELDKLKVIRFTVSKLYFWLATTLNLLVKLKEHSKSKEKIAATEPVVKARTIHYTNYLPLTNDKITFLSSAKLNVQILSSCSHCVSNKRIFISKLLITMFILY